MEFLDEKFVKLRHEMKKEEHADLETGIYYNNELVEFSRRSLPELGISMVLPTSFVVMPGSIARAKYLSEYRPELILTSMDTAVNFTFSLIDQEMLPSQVRDSADYIYSVMQRLNPAQIFFEKEKVDSEELLIDWFDYKSFAVDDPIYNVMYLASVWGKILQGTFNCIFKDMDSWKPVVLSAIKSIELLDRVGGISYERTQA